MNWQEFLQNSVFAALIIIVAVLIGTLLSRVLSGLGSRHSLPRSLLMPLRIFLRYGLFLVTFFLILTAYRIDVGSFWTLLSAVLGLIAIGFVAVWSMLSNISATFLIMIFKPFRMGDTVELMGDGVKGSVQDLSLMYTTLGDKDGNRIHIPNNLFFQKMIKLSNGPSGEKEPEENALSKALQPDHSKANLEGIKGWQSGRSK